MIFEVFPIISIALEISNIFCSHDNNDWRNRSKEKSLQVIFLGRKPSLRDVSWSSQFNSVCQIFAFVYIFYFILFPWNTIIAISANESNSISVCTQTHVHTHTTKGFGVRCHMDSWQMPLRISKLIIKLQASRTFIHSHQYPSFAKKGAFCNWIKRRHWVRSELIRKGVSYLLLHLSLPSFIRLFCKERERIPCSRGVITEMDS